MKTYTTEIEAKDPGTGKLNTYSGPRVPGNSFKEAESYCNENGLGYCKVTGEFVEDIEARKVFKTSIK